MGICNNSPRRRTATKGELKNKLHCEGPEGQKRRALRFGVQLTAIYSHPASLLVFLELRLVSPQSPVYRWVGIPQSDKPTLTDAGTVVVDWHSGSIGAEYNLIHVQTRSR
ncbi:hypothetical protein GN956_G24293 [Arapaima gigas]